MWLQAQPLCRGCCWLPGASHPPPCGVKLGHQVSSVCVRMDGTRESALQTPVVNAQLHAGKSREGAGLSAGAQRCLSALGLEVRPRMCPACLRPQSGRKQVVRAQDRVFCVGPLVRPGCPAASLPPGQPDPRLGVLSACACPAPASRSWCAVCTRALARLCLCSV